MCAAEIRNAYMQVYLSCKEYIIYGADFGLENVGRVTLIHRDLYGGKSDGADFTNHLRSCIQHLDFVSCPANPYVWMRRDIQVDGSEYYEYVLLYTNDALALSENL